MDKKFAVVCAVGAFCGVAQSQSSVSLLGSLDVGWVSLRAAGRAPYVAMGADGNSDSFIGLRGVEDLGGGVAASVWLEAAFRPDSGSGVAGANPAAGPDAGLNFNRRSTVGIAGGLGELRLGRDYLPTFVNLTIAVHPFGVNGVGSAAQLFVPLRADGSAVHASGRASRAINYFTPDFGRFSANIMYAAGEAAGAPGAGESEGRYVGGRLAYRDGPLTLAAATGKSRHVAGNCTQGSLGMVYQVGPARLSYLRGDHKVGAVRTEVNMVGVQFKLSHSGELRMALTELESGGPAGTASQIALGYLHSLSRRTALYGNYSMVDNKGAGLRFVVGGIAPGGVAPGGNSSGLEFGIRHSL